MPLVDLLTRQKSSIIREWERCVIDTYPPDYVRFLTETKDRFNNPVGYTLSKTIDNLFHWLIGQLDDKELSEHVDSIVQIRAVQDFSASGAVGWVFSLKYLIRKQFDSDIQDQQLFEELLDFESKIDRLALVIFDSFMKNRERIYDIKYNELKRRSSRLLERFSVMERSDQNKKE